MALGGSRTSSFDVVLQFNRHCRHRPFPGRAVLTFFRQKVFDLGTPRYFKPRYHIVLERAHTIMAQACVSVLLQLDDCNVQNDVEENAPLARYAAEHWVNHAPFEDVGSRIKGMQYLFDLDKPYFAAWRELYDIDAFPSAGTVFVQFVPISKSDATPLYYAALCGFPKFVE
jgi:hypothetical protein